MMINPASQVIAALLIGLLTTFTCQLLLTNVGLALGITIWGGPSWQQHDDDDSKDTGVDDSKSGSIGLGTLSIAAGLGLLLTVNSVLFVACYIAVKFCMPVTAFAGAILGWVVWSAYMLVMTWVSTQAANSLVAFILSSAVSGLRQIFAVLGSLLQSTFSGEETSVTPTALAKQVRQETQLALEQIDIPALIEDYIDEQMPPQLRLETVQPQLENTLQRSGLGSAPGNVEQRGFLSQINLSTFGQWVKDEIGLSGDIADTIANLLNQVWQRIISSDASPVQQLQDLFATASVDEFIPERISSILERLQPDNRHDSELSIAQGARQLVPSESTAKPNSADGISRQLRQILRQRLDLTDLDIQTIWRRLSPLLTDWHPGATSSSELQIIREDVDDYLQQVFPWRLNHAILQQEFREVLVDPEAAADQVLLQLQALSPEDFADSLKQRGDLTAQQIDECVTELEAIRQSAIASLSQSAIDQGDKAADASEADTQNETSQALERQTAAIAELQKKLENYLHYTSLSQITADAVAHKVATLVEEAPVSVAKLHQVSPQLPTAPLIQVLDSRRGLDSAQRDQLIHRVQEAWQHATASNAIAHDESLNDGPINPEVAVAVEGVLVLTVAQLISRRIDTQDLLPQLMRSLENVTSDSQQLRRSIGQIDWQALRNNAQAQLEVSEANVEQAVQTVQAALVDLFKLPQRWALRRSAAVKDFWDNVTEYLSRSHPDQLEPAAMRHNLEWLWQASNQALDALPSIPTESAAISSFDGSMVKDTLIHRQDLAAEQIETIEATLNQFMQSLLHQANQARQQAQAFLESWLAAVKAILQDPEQRVFDPDQLKTNLRSLLQNSSHVFATLTQPLNLLDTAEDSVAAIAQLSQEALQQLLKVQGVPKVLLAQAEGLPTWIQAKLAAVEQDLQHRQTVLKQTALQRLEGGRKALAAAAWWLFAIAITSGTTATVAGILAVTGFDAIWLKLRG
ncbi:MAG: hypothetical protein ACFBSF_22530 [Leptolyngbyaceae cyanobacterium]